MSCCNRRDKCLSKYIHFVVQRNWMPITGLLISFQKGLFLRKYEDNNTCTLCCGVFYSEVQLGTV